MAEREGFEPPEPCGSTDFESAAIDHSATSPRQAEFYQAVSFSTPPIWARNAAGTVTLPSAFW
jgi:hypothetical protein